MALRTAAASGNASATGTWSGGVIPVNGDTILVPTGFTVTIDYNLICGDTASAVGHAIQVNGTNSSTFGRLLVAAGVTLTLRGKDRVSNTCGLTNAFGEFAPQPGSIVLLGGATDGSTIFINNGLVTIVGTPSSHITLKSETQTWSTTGGASSGSIARTNSTGWDTDRFVSSYYMGAVGLSNAAGTALGSFGDSSVSFSAQSPAGILATPVASIDAITAAGHYYVDHANGVVYWFQNSGATFSWSTSYKKLAFAGVTIQSFANASGNQCVSRFADWWYLGNQNLTDDFLLYGKTKFTSSGTLRDFQVTNNSFNFCRRTVMLGGVTGTAAAPIRIEDNAFNGCDGDTSYGTILGVFRTSNSWVSFQRNAGRVGGGNIALLLSCSTAISQSNWTIADNAFQCMQFIEGGTPDLLTYPDLTFDSNFMLGIGSLYDSRQVTNVGGTNGHPAMLTNNVSWRGMRVVNLASYSTLTGNIIAHCYHHSIAGPTSYNDIFLTTCLIANNFGIRQQGGGFAQFGYNRRQWWDNVQVLHNTLVKCGQGGGGSGVIEYGDQFDQSGTQMMSKMTQSSNLLVGCTSVFLRRADATGFCTRTHLVGADFNFDVGTGGTRFTGLTRFATFTGWLNIPGVNFQNPSYAAPFAGKSLVFTYNSATDRTLAWDGGAAVQLVQYSGQFTGVTVNPNGTSVGQNSWKFSDSTKTFPGTSTGSSYNNANSPVGGWLMITGGTGAGQVGRITDSNLATAFVAVFPPGSTQPDTTSTYVIIKGEVTLTAADANTVLAGFDPRAMPATTQTDTIAMDLNSGSGTQDPVLVDSARDLRSWDTMLGGPGTEDSAFARIFADPTTTRTSFAPYLKAGMVPKVLIPGHDGAMVGAIAPSAGSVRFARAGRRWM